MYDITTASLRAEKDVVVAILALPQDEKARRVLLL